MRRIITITAALLLISLSIAGAGVVRTIDGDPVRMVEANLQIGDEAADPSITATNTQMNIYANTGAASAAAHHLRLDCNSSHNDSSIKLVTVGNLWLGGNDTGFTTYWDTSAASDYRMDSSPTIMDWNTGDVDIDWRIRGDTVISLFYLDAGLDQIGVGTNTPAYLLDVAGSFSANSINVNEAYTLPTADGSANQVLTTDGAGSVSWAAGGGGSSYWSRTGTDLEPLNSGDDVVLTNGETMGLSSAVASNETMFFSVTADANSRLAITADGSLNWGSGSAAADLTMLRGGAGRLELADGDILRLPEYLELAEVVAGDVLTAGAGYGRIHILGDGRAYSMDDAGHRHDLSIRNVVTLQGSWLADTASSTYDTTETQSIPCAVTSSSVYTYDWASHEQSEGNGGWSWEARRDQMALEYSQAAIATGGGMDYNSSDTLKIRAKVKPYCIVDQGSAPSGGSYWESISLYVSENSGDNSSISADLQSSTSNNAWTIIEADFDISSWSVGADEALYFGIEAIGIEVEDPDPDPLNIWMMSISVEWIEAIAWMK